jgi:carbamoyltransferase
MWRAILYVKFPQSRLPPMKVLSLHHGHDTSVTAFEDGRIVYHLELERLLSIKHFTGVQRPNAIPFVLENHVLPQLGWLYRDIDVINLGSTSVFGFDAWHETPFRRAISCNNCLDKPWHQWQENFQGKSQTFITVNHHVAHMAYAYYTSPFDHALLFSYDGEGDFECSSGHGVGNGNRLEYQGDLRHFVCDGLKNNSIGYTFAALGNLFPFVGKDELASAGKAMGFSSYGTPRDEWRAAVRHVIGQWLPHPQELVDRLGLDRTQVEDANHAVSRDLMATIQSECERYVAETVKRLRQMTGEDQLCLCGGCALNVLINSYLIEQGVKRLYVPPACSDCGVSLGGALYYWHNVCGAPHQPCGWHNPYLGDPVCNKHIVQEIFQGVCSNPNYTDLVAKLLPYDKLFIECAQRMSRGAIIAWAQDRGEIGPRALGNRSILCSPAIPGMKDTLNFKVKHREWWRPFAPICLSEHATEWFEIDHEQPYMLEAPRVRPEKAGQIPAVVHVDGTARLQTVRSDQNWKLYQLLQAFHQVTQIPILLNTSLNGRGQPIANDVKRILNLLVDTELDYAVVDNFLVGKK